MNLWSATLYYLLTQTTLVKVKILLGGVILRTAAFSLLYIYDLYLEKRVEGEVLVVRAESIDVYVGPTLHLQTYLYLVQLILWNVLVFLLLTAKESFLLTTLFDLFADSAPRE